jgi:hypothetical protein
VLLVDNSIPEENILSRLTGAGIGEVLSESTEPVLVSNWSGLENMSLAQAHSQLLPIDPRFDFYLQRLGLWFETRAGNVDYRVYYLRSAVLPFESDSALAAKLSRSLKDYSGHFMLPESDGYHHDRSGWAIPFVAAFLILLSVSILEPLIGKSSVSMRVLFERIPVCIARDRVCLRLVLVLPWAALAVGGVNGAAISALGGIALIEIADIFDIPLEEFRTKGNLRSALELLILQKPFPLVMPFVALVAILASPAYWTAVIIAFSGSFFAVAGYALLTSNRAPLRARFIPLPIGGRWTRSRRPPSAVGRVRAMIACVVIGAWGLCRFLMPGMLSEDLSSVAYPTPIERGGTAGLSIEDARARAPEEVGARLPSLASYLEHIAIQEALPYVPVGEGRPDPFAPVLLPMPSGPVANIVFDEVWAHSALKAIEPLSIEGMLLQQGEAVEGQRSPAGLLSGRGWKRRPLASIEWLLYIFLLVPPIGRLFAGIPSAKGTDAASGELRQEA